MDWFPGSLIILLLFIAFGLGWHIYRLRRRLNSYSNIIRRATSGGILFSDLPSDVPGLDDLSNAVKGLTAALNSQLSTVETERAKLASVLEQMTDGVLIADTGGRVAFLNPAAGRMFEGQAAVGRRMVEVLRQYQLVEAWRRCQETGEAQSETVELPARRQFLQLFVLPDRHTGGTLLLVQDLTRVRRLETVRRDFISNLSHELRTPLASLKALTETLRDGALDDPEAAPRFLGRIETEVDALTQMAQELLELSRIESGQVPLELTTVDPARLLDSSAERMRAQAERAGLMLTVEVAADMPEVRGDAARLEQVLVNLIHNALKFTDPGGSVTLTAKNDGPYVRFAIRDTGAGIPEDDLERIFERFYKADQARSGGGTGLGLSIARHIVEAHGGRIWAESRESQGSTFFFTIPAY
ncbi:MAG: PAS domain-containing protein [Chloroflexi bacterium]|nr:PAS domain-containing protein [Chloroflexota bacterium]